MLSFVSLFGPSRGIVPAQGGLELPAGRARDLVLEAVAVVESSNQYDQALG